MGGETYIKTWETVVFCWCLLASFFVFNPRGGNAVANEPEESVPSPDVIAQANGYVAERHSVTTKDGYVLGLFRLPGNDTQSNGSRSPVLLVPGILNNAAVWFFNDKNSLPYRLVDQGFDVWVAAGRGVRYSRGHVSLSNTSREYWNYSFHEHGIYDVPALIDYVLDHTGRPTLQYVGYSMGAGMVVVTTSMLGAYRERISHLYLVSPGVYLHYSTSPLVRSFGILGALTDLVTPGRLSFESPVVRKVAVEICSGAVTDELCAALLGGRDPNKTEEQLKFIYQYFPDTVSAKTLLHYSQGLNQAWFRQYDYGSVSNLRLYGSVIPPSYPLINVTVPTTVFYGADDILIGVKSAEQLIEDLPNVKRAVKVAGLTHVDVIWGNNAPASLYDPLLRSMLEDRPQ